MGRSRTREPPRTPGFRIESCDAGYRVVGDSLWIWEPTFQEAADWRNELEAPGCRYRLLPAALPPSLPFYGIAYGPVRSRRFGRSLGVNLSPPGLCVCTFRCAYCEFGSARRQAASSRWPAAREVSRAVADALRRKLPIDSITISGQGEPTLHPRFEEMVEAILAQARTRPEVCVRVLTNGAGALRPGVRRALDLLDERIVKLDAGAQYVNRPAAAEPLGALIFALSLLRDFVVQSCFVEGAVSNTGDETVGDWIELVSEIQPGAVQIYTINRPPANADVYPAPLAHLEGIARMLRERTGIETHVYA